MGSRQGVREARVAESAARAVLVCQVCPYVWEPAVVTPEEFAELVRSGCPDCGGWVWLGELIEAGGRG
jgi:hypothetical protein